MGTGFVKALARGYGHGLGNGLGLGHGNVHGNGNVYGNSRDHGHGLASPGFSWPPLAPWLRLAYPGLALASPGQSLAAPGLPQPRRHQKAAEGPRWALLPLCVCVCARACAEGGGKDRGPKKKVNTRGQPRGELREVGKQRHVHLSCRGPPPYSAQPQKKVNIKQECPTYLDKSVWWFPRRQKHLRYVNILPEGEPAPIK